MFVLNKGQQAVVNAAINWFYYGHDQVFQYDGPPGSGKSVVLNEIVSRLGLDIATQVAPMSYIGCASLVMRTKGLESARTAHSWLYSVKPVPLKDKDGNVVIDEYYNKPITVCKSIPNKTLPPGIRLIIIDEAYSMPINMRRDIEKFHIKIIACGDQNQLPPVNGEPAYLVRGNIMHLTECMRTIECPDVSYLVNRVCKGMPILNGYYGNSLVIDAEQLSNDLLLWADVIVCYSNRTRDFINKHIRELLGFKGKLPQHGEKIVCRKNNWNVSQLDPKGYEFNLVNGLIGVVSNYPDVSTLTKDGLFNISFDSINFPGISFDGLRANYRYMVSEYSERDLIKQNRYTIGELFEFAYAITAYIAQGSQFHRVLYLEEPMRDNIRLATNVVGASRADTSLVYVKNFNLDKVINSNIL